MNYKPKNLFNKGSAMILITLLTCLTLTFCSRDMDDASIMEVESTVDAKSLYFYGSDADFEKFEEVDMTQITSEGELNAITKTAGNSYALFVGKDIDVRSGIIDNLRNSGILVTQLEEAITEPKKLPAQALRIKGNKISGTTAKNVATGEPLNDEEFLLTTYLSVSGERKMLGSIFDDMEEAVPHILNWREEKLEERENANISKSGNKVRKLAMNWDFTWGGLANFSIDTEVFQADTDGYVLNDGTGTQEYPDVFIYEHKISTVSTNSSYNVNDIQIIQDPLISSVYDHSLREYSPLNGDNEVLNGRTGSDSFGYSVSYGLDVSGPSVSAGLDWSHSTDWSIPACQVLTHHDPSQELFHVQYDVDPFGAWNNQSVSAENYTYFASSEFANYIAPSYYRVPMTYFFDLYAPSEGDQGYRSLLIYMNSNSEMNVTLYHRGYFGDGRSTTAPGYSW
ncbi:hypothetical protein EZY14_019505 [Kordia sp. TARA_039_SRF]|nr:hypothetical protein EZY14_019505 [Kordia sp. TARA_039_SRF]